ncbi:uncharacterized protein LOC129771487 [Toxorhynchites rutilus septentrionalis]|uniref:uncharacterized protein LOC129771487 n=1 Tax=Toxorhynchites rutilus septentrionalis TaxID=329112 RepID=UPI00247AED5B|nr:uncharacterized protein LOC129771487 [Toxorhynchites rutilus septentrionalis]
MDLKHLTPEELDFELMVRTVKGLRGQDHKGKMSRLFELLSKEDTEGTPAPTSSTHVLPDVDSIYQCQAKLPPILQAVESALRQKDELQAKICRSRLMHYKFRLSIISDPMITSSAMKTLTKIDSTLDKLNEFLANFGEGEIAEEKELRKNPDEIPGDTDTQQRLKITQLQSSLKESSHHQQLLEQESQQQLYQQEMQQQKVQPMSEEAYEQRQYQQIQEPQAAAHLHQQQLHNEQQFKLQQQRHEQQLQQALHQMQQQHQRLEQQLHQEQVRRQGIEQQLQDQLNQRIPVAGLRSNNAIWDPHQQNHPSFLQQVPEMDNIPPHLRDDFLRFLTSRNRPSTPRTSIQHSIANRFTQPVHKWPFEYAGQSNIIQLGEFLNQVNTYADTEGMDEQTLLRSIKHLLKGRALQWYTRSYLTLTTWEIFKTEIKQEFLSPNYSEIVKQDLYLRFQGPNESFTSFYRDLVAAFEIVEPAISESEKLFIIKSHLNSDFSPIAAASRACKVRDLVAVCKDFEVSRSYSSRGRTSTTFRTVWTKHESSGFHRPTTGRMDTANRPMFNRQPYNTAQVHAMELNQDIDEELDSADIQEREAFQQDMAFRNEAAANTAQEVNAVRGLNNWREESSSNSRDHLVRESNINRNMAQENNINRNLIPVILCWQCDNPGHTYLNCPHPKRFLFCYSCGKKGCTTRNCETCMLRWRQLDSRNNSKNLGNRNRENPQ